MKDLIRGAVEIGEDWLLTTDVELTDKETTLLRRILNRGSVHLLKRDPGFKPVTLIDGKPVDA